MGEFCLLFSLADKNGIAVYPPPQLAPIAKMYFNPVDPRLAGDISAMGAFLLLQYDLTIFQQPDVCYTGRNDLERDAMPQPDPPSHDGAEVIALEPRSESRVWMRAGRIPRRHGPRAKRAEPAGGHAPDRQTADGR